MPELPEVETIARNLRQGGQGYLPLVGRKIIAVDLLWQRTLATPGADEFASRLPGRQIFDVSRRGKYLVLRLDEGYLLFHLRMSGDLRVENAVDFQGRPLSPAIHDRAIISLENNTRLVFNDTRKFGRIWLVDSPEIVLGGLGPEPLSDEFTPELLESLLRKRRRQIKSLLMDQSILAGLGNIYADEVLHTAKIYPETPSDQLEESQITGLWKAIRFVLGEGIRLNGASIDWAYRGGSFQNQFRVYQRTGQPCLVCGATIQRIVVGQRGTHFCPICQPAHKV